MWTAVDQFPWKPEQKIPVLLQVYSAVGQRDRTIALLQQAVVNHSNAITGIKVDPMYDPLRSAPPFSGSVAPCRPG